MPGGTPPQFTPVHFVHRQQESLWGVTLANRDAAFLKGGMFYMVANEDRRASTRDEGPQQLFRAEPRSSPVQSFRFCIAAQEENAAKWKRFGAECNLPLRSVVIEASPSQPERGFFEISDPQVQLLAFKPAEFQPEWHVLRFQNNGSEGVQGVQLTTVFRIKEAVRANTAEEASGEKINLANFSLRPWQTLTVLVRLQ
jgi:alpha-mannosidase